MAAAACVMVRGRGGRAPATAAMQIDMDRFGVALGEEGRAQMHAEMARRSKLNNAEDRVYLRHEVKIGEHADAMLHRLPRDTSKVDTSLWRDRPPPCRGARVRSSTYASISGDSVRFPLERVECAYSRSGCCDADENPTPAERNGGSDDFLGYDEHGAPRDYRTPQEVSEDEQDAAAWKLRDVAARQQASGGGVMSPLLAPAALHAQHDAATLAEQSKLSQESAMEQQLEAEMHKVRVMKRLLVQRQREREKAAQAARDPVHDAERDSVWKGVQVHLTPEDLRRAGDSKAQTREDARWQERNLTNLEWNAELEDLPEELTATRDVMRADERALRRARSSVHAGTAGNGDNRNTRRADHSRQGRPWRGGDAAGGDGGRGRRRGRVGREGRETAGRGAGGVEAQVDRAQQAEIAQVTPPSSSLWWEWEPRLHYHDLSPAGKPTRAADSLRFARKAGTQRDSSGGAGAGGGGGSRTASGAGGSGGAQGGPGGEGGSGGSQ